MKILSLAGLPTAPSSLTAAGRADRSSFSLRSQSQIAADSALASLSSNQYTVKLEKRLDDYQKSRPNSSGIDRNLLLSKQQTSTFLATTDPSALGLYQGVISGLQYSQKARFIKGSADGVKAAGELHRAADELEKLRVEGPPKELMEAFGLASSVKESSE